MSMSEQDGKHIESAEEVAAAPRNARIGLALFSIYFLLYGGFMGLNAFSPERMAEPALMGVNLAIVYGFGLIIGAVLLALVYMFLCRTPVKNN
jgi:uncharacterized membrane protein (DUF485 family)